MILTSETDRWTCNQQYLVASSPIAFSLSDFIGQLPSLSSLDVLQVRLAIHASSASSHSFSPAHYLARVDDPPSLHVREFILSIPSFSRADLLDLELALYGRCFTRCQHVLAQTDAMLDASLNLSQVSTPVVDSAPVLSRKVSLPRLHALGYAMHQHSASMPPPPPPSTPPPCISPTTPPLPSTRNSLWPAADVDVLLKASPKPPLPYGDMPIRFTWYQNPDGWWTGGSQHFWDDLEDHYASRDADAFSDDGLAMAKSGNACLHSSSIYTTKL